MDGFENPVMDERQPILFNAGGLLYLIDDLHG